LYNTQSHRTMRSLLLLSVTLAAVQAQYEAYEKWYNSVLDPLKPALRRANYSFTWKSPDRELCRKGQNTSKASCWEVRSEFQHSIVLDTGNHLGRVLYLDCMGQSSEADEFIYHETLVQAAMTAHPAPRNVLIAGGGEGGTAREILKHKGVQKVTMVDLDTSLVSISEKYLPYWNGVKEDPRFTLLQGDAIAWMNQTSERFDIIIFDLPDFIKGTETLYQMPVLELAKELLTDAEGIVATHSGGNVCTDPSRIDCRYIPILLNTYRKVFGEATLLMAPMPMWDILHGFIVGTAKKELHYLPAHVVNNQISHHVGNSLRFYNGVVHEKMTTIPDWYMKFMKSQKEVLDEAIGRKAPASKPTEWKSCSCDQSKCIALEEEEEEDEEDEEDEDEEEDL